MARCVGAAGRRRLSNDDRDCAVILLAAEAGLRAGEIRGLQWGSSGRDLHVIAEGLAISPCTSPRCPRAQMFDLRTQGCLVRRPSR